VAYTLKFHDEFTGESSNTEIQNHTPTDLGTSWSVTSNITNAPDVNASDSTLIQEYHSTAKRQGCIANISGGWASSSPKQRGEWLPNQWGKVWPTLYLNESAGGYPQGYSAIWSNNYYRVIRYDDGASAFTTVVFGDQDFDGNGKAGTTIVQLTCEPGSQGAIFDGGTYSALGGTDTTYSTGKPGSAGFKTQPSGGVGWVKFYEDAGAAPITSSGTPSLSNVTSSGAGRIIKEASGSPSIGNIVSSGSAKLTRKASGSPSIEPITSTGVASSVTVIDGSGTPSIANIVSSGIARRIVKSQGSASLSNIISLGEGYKTGVKITSVVPDPHADGATGIQISGTGFIN
jgi:hypothetical protein